MKIYLAGAGRGNSCVSEKEYSFLLRPFIPHRLFSYWYLLHSEVDWQGFKINKDNTMKLYFAGGENRSWFECISEHGNSRLLFSYFYIIKNEGGDYSLNLACKQDTDIFLDSGAFSAFTRGAEIDLDEYIDFIHKYKKHITVYSSLDVIGDWKASLKNQERMEKKGLNPLWVFHYARDAAKEPYELLRDQIQKYDYIALGGMAGREDKSKIRRHLERCFNIIGGSWPKKVHGFGTTAPDMLKDFPFYSVDSTSWLGGSTRSEVNFFNMGDMETIYVGDEESLKLKTVSLLDFPDDKRWFDRVANNAIEWVKFEKYVTRLWKARGVKFDGC